MPGNKGMNDDENEKEIDMEPAYDYKEGDEDTQIVDNTGKEDQVFLEDNALVTNSLSAMIKKNIAPSEPEIVEDSVKDAAVPDAEVEAAIASMVSDVASTADAVPVAPVVVEEAVVDIAPSEPEVVVEEAVVDIAPSEPEVVEESVKDAAVPDAEVEAAIASMVSDVASTADAVPVAPVVVEEAVVDIAPSEPEVVEESVKDAAVPDAEVEAAIASMVRDVVSTADAVPVAPVVVEEAV
ncbi:Hypothetical protein PHPALM_11202, partial [Phytophthora palmivora]